jgi:Tol biopolymer transport system component
MTRRLQRSSTLAFLSTLCLVQAGCSSKDSATAPPPFTPPTHFAVFTSTRDGTHNYITDLDGSGAAKFVIGTASGIVDRRPSITASAVLLVYQSAPGRGGSEDVFGFNRTSGSVIDDSNVNTTANETDPYVSLDGQRVAFVRDTLGQKRIRLYDTQNLRFIPLPNLPGAGGNDWQPALDGVGGRIAFVSDRNGNADVFVYDVGTQSLRVLPLLVSAGDDVEPSVSGNARFIGFASNRSGGLGGYDLLMLDMNTNLLVTLTANSAANDRDPSVSSDGNRIHFVSDRAGGTGGRDLWLYTHTAGSVTRVTNQNSTAEDYDPVIVWP